MEILKTNGYIGSTMGYDFIALDKYGKEAKWLRYFLGLFRDGQNSCLQFAYIAIVNLLLREHKTVCIMVSLDIFIGDTMPFDKYSRLGLSL